MPYRASLVAVAASVLALGATSAAASPFNIRQGSPRVSIPTDRVACAAQPGLAWCSPQVTPVANREWSRQDIYRVDLKLRSNFHYQLSMRDGWRSRLEEATTRKGWSADCDGFTFTVMDALAREGFPLERMWRVIVIPKDNKYENVKHMIGVVEIDGDYWVVGDTASRAYRLSEAEFTPYLVSNVAAGTSWLRVASAER